MKKTYMIHNKQSNEMLIWTASYDPEVSINRLLHLKRQPWNELEAEGYEAIEIIVIPADELSAALAALKEGDTL